ncbi:TlpA family protein disulfide reductase [Algoriphagus sp. AGSA1]|uniref:TlpA family protein disulfide reductase n=1 Tax=Algoriphagus sp. AGSA1 TaxID=2907213 RepID=UPI001F36215D|nr:TlpA disulfide reductase family protein [Algoriphagus sp. AGSA1]MCE7053682.1 TlpA family protein disulfide reductase [Algoriphagus sp. AGSA1]
MKKHILICLMGLLCLPISTTTAQVADSPTPGQDLVYYAGVHRGGETRSDTLSIGDQIPKGIEFSEVLKFDSDKLRLDDYRGKYLILEFWAPTCTASIASLPRMANLSREFRDQIAIIPMTIFEEERVSEVFAGYESLVGVDLPLVLHAGKMRELFPHSTIPHFVIVDPEGKVIAITGLEDLTSSNLEKMLSGDASVFRYKEDRKILLGRYDKLISESPQVPSKNIWFQSALTGYIPDVSGSIIQEYEDLSHIRIVNMPLIRHYQLAFSERDLVDYYGRNRIQTIGFEAEELFTKKTGMDYLDWKEQGYHVFGYELIAPPSQNPYALMREDLNRYFPHIKASVKKEKRKVYAIVQQEGTNYPKAQEVESSYQAGAFGLSMQNYPLQGFVYHLNFYFYQRSEFPILNLTGIDYPIDLELEAQLSSISSLKQALRQVGLDLLEKEVEINVLVLEKIGDAKVLAL